MKRKFCSEPCKEKSQMLPNLSCEECGKGYYKPPSLLNGSRFCSRKCMNKKLSVLRRINRERRECGVCNQTFICLENSKRIFCSRSCSGKSLMIERVLMTCESCNKKYERIKTYPSRFCSRDCQYHAQSSGLIRVTSSGRSGFRLDLDDGNYYKSSLEADFARFCKYSDMPYKYEPVTFKIVDAAGRERRYTPDFFLPESGLYVELKGIRKDRKYEKNLECLRVLQEKREPIVLVSMKEFYSMLKSENIFHLIENLEYRNYKETKGLATKSR